MFASSEGGTAVNNPFNITSGGYKVNAPPSLMQVQADILRPGLLICALRLALDLSMLVSIGVYH